MSEQKKHVKLFIATPAFGHQVTTNYANSLLKFVSTSHPRLAVSSAVHLQSGMALVTQARNNCVAYFLNSDCTHFLFIDADIGFEPDAIYRLIEKDVPLCLTPYPVKGYGANNQLQFIVHFPDKDNVRIQKDGFAEITAGPTGFMMIKREVFEKLAEKYPERKTVNKQLVGNKVETMEKGWYTFFETAQDPENGYLGEDIAFCRLWTNIGGKIYADTQTPLTHFGSHAFHGSLNMMFAKQKPIDDKPKE
ncbi:MAG: hypothetical protein KXJ45_01670 [Candidatus Fonsibacter sp.]|jgi:hypothetical protein|nr:hypothetical protein [Candidatus Fonsibacter sp.]